MRLELGPKLVSAHQELLKLPERAAERIAFAADPLLEGPLRDTNFRLTRRMLAEIEDLVDPAVVTPLRQTIIDSRVRAYRGLLLSMGVQTWFLASLASGSSPLLETVLQVGAIGAGASVETYDRRRAYFAVREAAIPVTTELVARYGGDLDPRSDKDTLPIELAKAIAIGEKLPHPQLTHFAHFLTTMVILRQPELLSIVAGRSAYEFFLQRYLGATLEKGASLTEAINTLDEAIGLSKQIQVILGRDVTSILSIKDFLTRSWKIFNQLSLMHGLVEFGLKTGVPIAAVLKNVPTVNYLAALAGFSGSYLEPLFAKWNDYAVAKAGVEKLQTVLDTIRRNQISLLTEKRLAVHCQASIALPPVEIPDQADAVAVLAPFALSLPGKRNLLHMEKPLVLRPGFTDISAARRSGVTSFLKALAHWIKTEDRGESLIKLGEEWRLFHSLGDVLHTNIIFLPAEPQLIQYEHISTLLEVSPRALFGHLFGAEAEVGFRQHLAGYQIEIKGKIRSLFTDDEIKIICEAQSLTDLDSSLRAKLRLIHALEQRPRILLIDCLLDSLEIEEAVSWSHFIGEWSKQTNAAVVIATNNHPVRTLLRGSPYYSQTIFIEDSQVCSAPDGPGRTVLLTSALSE